MHIPHQGSLERIALSREYPFAGLLLRLILALQRLLAACQALLRLQRMATAELVCMLPHMTQDTHDPGAPAASNVYLRLQLSGAGF